MAVQLRASGELSAERRDGGERRASARHSGRPPRSGAVRLSNRRTGPNVPRGRRGVRRGRLHRREQRGARRHGLHRDERLDGIERRTMPERRQRYRRRSRRRRRSRWETEAPSACKSTAGTCRAMRPSRSCGARSGASAGRVASEARAGRVAREVGRIQSLTHDYTDQNGNTVTDDPGARRARAGRQARTALRCRWPGRAPTPSTFLVVSHPT